MRSNKSKIIIVLGLSIVFCLLILMENRPWIVRLFDFLSVCTNYIYQEREWVIPIIVSIILALIGLRWKPSPKIPTKRGLPIFEVENVKQLEEVTKPFLENPITGFGIKERKSWSDIKKGVDFSLLQPLDLSIPYKVFVIRGKPGIGKSTYMLWRVDELLQSKPLPLGFKLVQLFKRLLNRGKREGNKEFRRIIFLDPNNYHQWGEKLSEYKPKETLLVIDALWRMGDSFEVIKERCHNLFKLAIGEESVGRKRIGPFKVLLTIRDDEYDFLMRQTELGQILESVFVYEITPEKLDIRAILKKLLHFYGVQYEIPAEKEEEVIKLLTLKSEGIPFYICHLITDLKTTNKSFSERTLNEYPKGMINLIWQTIRKRYYIRDEVTIPFLLLLLLHTDKGFSRYFVDFVVDKLTKEKVRSDVRTMIENLKKLSFQSVSTFKSVEIFTLGSHWKEGVAKGLAKSEVIEDPFKEVVDFYKQIEDTRFQRLIERVAESLKNHLQNGFKDKADVFLCVDLAKMGEEYLDSATKIYSDFKELSRLPKSYLDYIGEELYELWISIARKYRASYYDRKVIYCYESAFYKLGIRTNPDDLTAYSYYIQTRVLPNLKDKPQELQIWKEKFKNLCNEALDLYTQFIDVKVTSEEYAKRRNSIKWLMKVNEITKKTQPDLYSKCIEARFNCAENSYKLNPNNWKNCGDYGEDLLEIGRYEDAILILEKGVYLLLKSNELSEQEKKKHLSWFYEKIGFCYKDQEKIPEAKEFLTKSAKIEDSLIAYFRLINWMYEMEEYQETINMFKEFNKKFLVSKLKEKEKIFPFIADVFLNVAVSYEKLNRIEEAATFWKYYADLSFYLKDPEEWSFVGRKLLEYHKFPEARECFLRSIRMLPSHAQNLSQLAYVSYKLQKWDECKICYRLAFSIRKDPRDEAYYLFVQQKHKNPPDFGKWEDLLDLAIIEELKGNSKRALRYYSITLELLEKQGFQNEANLLGYKFIGDSFWALGEKEVALKIYKEIKNVTTDYEKIVAEVIYWFILTHKEMEDRFSTRKFH